MQRLVRTVGAKFFIDHFDLLSDEKIDKKKKRKKLHKLTNYTVSGIRTRVNAASRLFADHTALKDALFYISNAGKIDDSYKIKAKKLLSRYK